MEYITVGEIKKHSFLLEYVINIDLILHTHSLQKQLVIEKTTINKTANTGIYLCTPTFLSHLQMHSKIE